MTAYQHQPVMTVEVLQWLRPRAGGLYVDGTVGGGGHASAILEASSPDGRLVGFDRDATAIGAARERLARYGGRFELVQAEFGEMGRHLQPETASGVLLDLGVSSFQLDTPERGFGVNVNGPLDMRMDQTRGQTAADVVNSWDAEELARLFRDNADEPEARRIARGIVRERSFRPIATTRDLADLVERLCPRRGRHAHPATRCFQALRMEVNDELGGLDRGLKAAMRTLAPGGRLCVITFESVTDRHTKAFFRSMARDYDVQGEVDRPEFRTARQPLARMEPRRAIQPGPEEVAANPRSRSAQLRVLEKLSHA